MGVCASTNAELLSDAVDDVFKYDDAQLRDHLELLWTRYDSDGNGVLDPSECAPIPVQIHTLFLDSSTLRRRLDLML